MIHNLSRWQQWCVLLVLTAGITPVLALLQFPGIWLIGPMLAGIIASCLRGNIRVHPQAFKGSKAMVGCIIAASLTPEVIRYFMQDWWLFLATIIAAIVASRLLGYMLVKRGIMPGTTAVWGTSPGAATAMMVMSEFAGADTRLVTFMQYTRVVLDTITASVMMKFAAPAAIDEALPASFLASWLAPVEFAGLFATLAVAFAGSAIASKLRLSASHILGPLVIGGALQGLGLIHMQFPPWLLALSFTLLGWRIGLMFDPASLRHAYRVLPAVLLSVITMMLFCGLLSTLLVIYLKIDPITAYLATTPSGVDTVTAIAASRPYVDMPFVITMQTVRLLLLSIICPPLARYISFKVATKPSGKTKNGNFVK